MKSCSFTGHRKFHCSPRTSGILESAILDVMKSGVMDFYAGGAIGWDTFCAETVINMRNRFPHIRLHIVLPCPPSQQSAFWSEKQRNEYLSVINAADSVECVSNSYHSSCMRARNQRLIALADCCICYYDSSHYRSGTGQTVRMAQAKGIVVINVFDILTK